MRENFHVTIPFFCRVALATQRRSQATLQPRDNALDLPSLPINAFMEPAAHLPAIFGLGPSTAADGMVQAHGRAGSH